MKQIEGKRDGLGFDPTEAKKYLAIARLLPAKFELKDVSVVFERMLTEPESSRLFAIEALVPHLKAALFGLEDPMADLDYHILILKIRSIAALDAISECCRDLPDEFTSQFSLAETIDQGRVYELLVGNGQFVGSLDAFVELADANSDWDKWASTYAGILDSVKRYVTVRSDCVRLDQIASIGGTFLRHNAYGVSKLWFSKNLFDAGQIVVRDGRIQIESDAFTEAFLNAPIDRIRLCKLCKKKFWADRKDMKCCTVACARAFRTRKWRENIENRKTEKYRSYLREAKEKK